MKKPGFQTVDSDRRNCAAIRRDMARSCMVPKRSNAIKMEMFVCSRLAYFADLASAAESLAHLPIEW